MIRLTLDYFQCWKHLQVEVKPKSVILIKGNSGGGKSTIFRAIFWCLYKNMKYVAPNKYPNAQTCVTLSIPIQKDEVFTIKRTKKKCIVTLGDKTWEDKVAQAIIEDTFGDSYSFLMTSYIAQKTMNSFLTLSNIEKLNFLYNIAYIKGNPSDDVEKAKKEVEKRQTLFKVKNGLFVETLETHKSMLDEAKNTPFLTIEEIEEAKRKLIEIKQEKKEWNAKCLVYQKQKEELIVLETRLKEVIREKEQTNKPAFHDPYMEWIDFIEKELNITHENRFQKLNKIEAYIKTLLEKLNKIYKINHQLNDLDISTIDVNKLKTNHVDEELYTQTKITEDKIKEIKKVLDKYDIPYDQHALYDYKKKKEEELKELKDYESYDAWVKYKKELLHSIEEKNEDKERKIQLELNIKDTINKLNTIKEETKKLEIDIKELESKRGVLTKQKKELERQKIVKQGEYKNYTSILTCPECSSYVSFENNKLHKHDTKQIEENKRDTLEIIEALIRQINQYDTDLSNIELSIKKFRTTTMEHTQHLGTLQYKTKTLEKELDIVNKKITTWKTKTIPLVKEKLSTIQKEEHWDVTEFEAIPKPTYSNTKEIKTSLVLLSNFNVLPIPSYTSQEIKDLLTQKEIVNKYTTLKEKKEDLELTLPSWIDISTIHPPFFDLPKYTSFIRETEKYLDNTRTYDRELEILLAKICQLKESRSKKEDPFEKVELLKQDKLTYLNVIEREAKETHIKQIREDLIQKRNEVVALNKELSVYYTLQNEAIKTEHDMLYDVISDINYNLSNLCEKLFTNDVFGNIELYKENKVTKITKPAVNFVIKKEGRMYNNFCQLSGGEADRISIALSIAFQKLKDTSCLLLLDETFSGLNTETMIQTVKTLKKQSNSTVIVIAQGNIVEGIFDATVNIEDYESNLL